MSFLKLFGLGKSKGGIIIQQINVTDAYGRVLDKSITLIDVRQPEEWNETGRPKGSHGVTLQDPDFLDKVLQLVNGDKAAPVAFSCKSGGRSSEAVERIKAAEHTHIYNVEGGFFAWSEAGLPIDEGPF